MRFSRRTFLKSATVAASLYIADRFYMLHRIEAQDATQETTNFLPTFQLIPNEAKQIVAVGDQPIHFTWDTSKPNWGSLLNFGPNSGLKKGLTQKIPGDAFVLAGTGSDSLITFAGTTFAEVVETLQKPNPGAVEVFFIPFTAGDKKTRFVIPIITVNRDIPVNQTINGQPGTTIFKDGTFMIPNPTTGEFHLIDQSATPDYQIKIVLASQDLADKMASVPITTPMGLPVIVGVDTNNITRLVITDKSAITIKDGKDIGTPVAQYAVLEKGKIYPTPEVEQGDLTFSQQFLVKGTNGSSHKITLGTNMVDKDKKLLTWTNFDLATFQKVLGALQGTNHDLRIELRDADNVQADMKKWKDDGYKVAIFYTKKITATGELINITSNSFMGRNGDEIVPIFVGSQFLEKGAGMQTHLTNGTVLNVLSVNMQEEIAYALYTRRLPYGSNLGTTSFGDISGEAVYAILNPEQLWWIQYFDATYTS